ncbi:MAG: DUF4157 domain-containing protein, partial [Alphaproteobacteria bacterium]
MRSPPVQKQISGGIRAVARQGVGGAERPLPHGDRIQASFGPGHDTSGIRAHMDGPARAASRAMGAQAYTTGSHVAFAGSSPSLRVA